MKDTLATDVRPGGCHIAERHHVDNVHSWNTLIGEHFGPVHVDAKSGVPFSAELRKTFVGEMTFYECLTSPACVSHVPVQTGTHIKNTYLIKVQLAGHSCIHGADHSVDLAPGDYVICDNTEAYTLDFDCDTQIVSVLIDGEHLERATPFPKKITFVKASLSNPIRRVAYDYLRSLIRNIGNDVPASARSDLARMFLQMAVISIAQEPTRRSPEALLPGRAGLFERCRKEIERSFRDENLNGQIIAGRLGVSLRSLQAAFAAHGHTITNYIAQCRLGEARKLLSTERYAQTQVSEIAYAVGFKSHAHFSRAYKAAYGETPKASRRLCR